MSHKENDKLIDDLVDREVKKPEKKDENSDEDFCLGKEYGYNEACDEWEAFLPSEGEILIKIDEVVCELIKQENKGLRDIHTAKTFKHIAKAISKRIRRQYGLIPRKQL